MKQTLCMCSLIALSLASCKKDRVCECKQTHKNFLGDTYSKTSTTHKKITKSEAKKRCQSTTELDSTFVFYPQAGGVASGGTYIHDIYDCKLK